MTTLQRFGIYSAVTLVLVIVGVKLSWLWVLIPVAVVAALCVGLWALTKVMGVGE